MAVALLCSVVSWAQTDVTSTYITNADFSAISGWTKVSTNFTSANTANKVTEWYRNSDGNNSIAALSQQLTGLNEGVYRMTIHGFFRTTKAYTNLAFFAETTDRTLYSPLKTLASGTAAYGSTPNSTGTAYTAFTNSEYWMNTIDNIIIDKTTNTSGNLLIGLKPTGQIAGNGSNHWICIGNVKLYKLEGAALDGLRDDIVSKATTLYNENTSATGAVSLNSAITTLSAIADADLTYSDIKTLQTAIETFRLARMVDATVDAPIDATFLIKNAGFEDGAKSLNNSEVGMSGTNLAVSAGGNYEAPHGWTTTISGAGNSWDNSNVTSASDLSMATSAQTTPTEGSYFYAGRRRWAKGTNTISQVINDLPNGSYKISVDLGKAAGAVAGTFTATLNGSSKMSATPANAGLTTYTSETFIVDDDNNDLTIQFANATSGSDDRRFIIDNVVLTYYGDPFAAARADWQATRDALDALDETALPDAAETAITDALAETEPTTIDGYNTAKAALQALIDSYDGIKAAYDKAKDLITFVTSEVTNSTGTKTTIEAAISTATTDIESRTAADDLTSDYNTLETARQTYVTSGAVPTSGNSFDWTFKLTNPDFENGTSGWTNEKNVTGTPYNYGTTESGMQHGTKGLDVWAPQINYIDVYQRQTLPAGVYEISAYVYSSGPYQQHVYANNGTDYPSANLESTSAWQKLTATFTNYEEVSTKMGLYSKGKNLSGNQEGWFRLDNFQLLFKGVTVDDATATALLATVPDGIMQESIETALDEAESAFDSDKTIANYNALKSAIDDANASISAYAKLKTELDKIPAGLGTTNVYTTSAYTTNYTDVLDSYTDRSISTDAANAYSYGSRVTGAMPAIMLSSWKVGETAALTDASLYMNTWSTEGNSDGSEMTTPFYEYWIADANALGAKTFTATVAGLTAGTSYLVTAKVRVRQQNEQEKADDDVTFQVNNGDVVNAADGTQSEIRPEMYYKTVRATGTADGEGKLAIKVVVKDGNHVSWLAFKDVHYSEVTTPTEEHKTALNNAISEAEAKTIGFEAGEYATYTNIDARKALAAAKAIDFEVNTDYEVVAATNALTSATWTVNAVEVNAVSDELFNGTEYAAAGWTRNVTWNNVSGGSYSIPAGAMTYGDMAYHEMPLKGNTVYKLTFGHRRWDNDNADNGGQVSVLNSNNQGLDLTAYAGTNSTTLQSGDYYFRTGAAGNYTFTVTATSGRLTFGNVIIKKATDGDLLLEDTETDAPANGYYQTMSTTRTLKGGQWNGFSVPFGFTVAGSALEGASVKQFASVADNVITMEDATEIVAGEPYLVKPTSDIENPTFEGVTASNPEEASHGDGDYKFKAHLYNTLLATDGSVAYVSTTDSSIKKLTSGGIKGMRAIFNIPVANNVKALTIRFGGDADGILSVDADGNITENGAIFNLAGQRVNKAQKGIYIVNGKKVLVK